MAKITPNNPRYTRSPNPPRMQLTDRDREILQAVHAYDGLLSFSQIQQMFFTGKSQAELRLRLLYQNGYLNRLDQEQRRRLPEMVYWLDRKGAELVASMNGSALVDLGWRKEPRWFQVEHDLVVNDFRIKVEQACKASGQVEVLNWVSESEFWAYPDIVTYKIKEREAKRRIRPDGFFILNTGQHRIRYLLEIDRSTEDNPRFLREKILPGLAYLTSDSYAERFGHRSGRWLVVTTGERRMNNMLFQARRANTKGLFYFTTFDMLDEKGILFSPIWQREDRSAPVPLLFVD